MANYATLKAAIQQVIKQNGNNEITGAILQSSLLSIINSLGANYQFAGVATPTTNPGIPDARVFYLASAGNYPNFDNITVSTGNLGILYYDSSWQVSTIDSGYVEIGKIADLIELGGKTDYILNGDSLVTESYYLVGNGGGNTLKTIKIKIPQRTCLLSLPETEWPVTSLPSSGFAKFVYGQSKNGVDTDMVEVDRDQIVAKSYKFITDANADYFYIKYRADVDIHVEFVLSFIKDINSPEVTQSFLSNNPKWHYGRITGTGAMDNSDGRYRYSDLLPANLCYEIYVDQGYNFIVYYYNKDVIYQKQQVSYKRGCNVKQQPYAFMRVAFYQDGKPEMPIDVLNPVHFVWDDGLNETISLRNMGGIGMPQPLYYGSISDVDGTIDGSLTHRHTPLIEVSSIEHIEIPDGYVAFAHYYSKREKWQALSEQLTGRIEGTSLSDYPYVRFVIRNKSASIIEPNINIDLIVVGKKGNSNNRENILVMSSIFKDCHNAWADKNNVYESWPNGGVFADGNNIVMIYNSRASHVDKSNSDVLMRVKYELEDWNTKTIIKAHGNGKSYGNPSACILPNGDYLVVITEQPVSGDSRDVGKFLCMKSTDKGVTWSEIGYVKVDGEDVVEECMTSLFCTSSGKLISFVGGLNGGRYIASNDYGENWEYVGSDYGTGILEAGFIEGENNDIYSVLRKNNSNPALIKISADFTQFTTLYSFGSFNFPAYWNPTTMKKLPNGKILLLGASRNKGSGQYFPIFEAVVTESELISNTINPHCCLRFNCPKAMDWGYADAAITDNGIIYGYFYASKTSGIPEIYEMIGMA